MHFSEERGWGREKGRVRGNDDEDNEQRAGLAPLSLSLPTRTHPLHSSHLTELLSLTSPSTTRHSTTHYSIYPYLSVSVCRYCAWDTHRTGQDRTGRPGTVEYRSGAPLDVEQQQRESE